MTEPSSFDAPDEVPALADPLSPPVTAAAFPAPSLPSPPAPPPALPIPTLATPPPRGPIVPSTSHHSRIITALPAAPSARRNGPKRRLSTSLLTWSIIVALVAMAGYLAGFWGPSSDTESAPATDGIEAVEGSTPRPAPTAGPTDAAAGVCVELQQVQVLTNEMALIMNAVIQEFTASSGEPDEAVLQARLQEAADLMDRSLPGLLSAYQSAAQLAPADVAADLRAVADGTALLTPPMVDVMRNARTVEDFAGLDQVLQTPELEEAAFSAGTASLRLDAFTIPMCGFKFSN